MFLMAAIGICVNGERREITGEGNITSMLETLSLPEKRIAVEVNGTVVSRSEWQQTMLRDGDRIEVVHFVGGG